jgi:hypothetical protein
MPGTSRRDFLKAGLCSAVIGAGVATVPLISGKGVKEAHAAAPHPWGYTLNDLDPEYTRKLGYQGYYLGECAYATFRAIIGQLQTSIGYPYTEIPLDMMRWGAGGVAGFASFCGTLNGAGAAFGLICDNANAKSLISALMSWYAETELPSATGNLYAANGEYEQILAEVGKTIKTTAALPSSVARANLCHASVTNWCRASGFASGSSVRSERCARLAGDVASKGVELLNDLFGTNGIPAYTVPGDKTSCRQCHYKGPDYFAGQFTRGKMDCLLCHSDLKQVNANAHHKGALK